MNESRFFKPKGFSISKLFDFSKFKLPKFGFKKSAQTTAPTMNTLNLSKNGKSKFNFGKWLKGLGVVGVVILLIVGIIGTLSFVFVIKPSYALVAQLNKIGSDKKMFDEEFSKQNMDGIKLSIKKWREDVTDLRKVRDDNFAWAKDFAYTKDYFRDVDYFVNSGIYLADALDEFIVVVEPFADATGFKSQTEVEVIDPNAGSGLADAISKWVSVMPEVADKMEGVIAKFDKVGEEMNKIDANRYPEYFQGSAVRPNILAAQQYLARASEFGPDIKAALLNIPNFLGVGSEKRYAIIMQNNGEIRATGGFWTSFATFKVRNALLNSDFTTNDMYSIDDYIALTDTPYTQPWPLPFAPYRNFLKVEHTWGRDANYYADYPTSVDFWLKFYKQAAWAGHPSAKPLNGVFAIDTNVLSELMKITGPVTVGGFTYTSDNVILEIEKLASLTLREQADRKKILGQMMQAMLINMYKAEKNLWPKFVETAIRLAVEKHILIYVLDNPQGQALLEKYNFSGRINPYDKGDYSYVVSTNLGGDKTNFFVKREVTHTIAQENGKWVHTVAVKFIYGQPMPGYEPLVKVYRDWVRVFAPTGSKFISVDGSDATTSADIGEERGRVYFAGHITLPPNETKTITFKYEIPASLVSGKSYNLYLQKQPGTHNDLHIVNFGGKSDSAELLMDKEVIIPIAAK